MSLCEHCQKLDDGWRDKPPPPHRAWTHHDYRRGYPDRNTLALIRAKHEEHRQLIKNQRRMIAQTCQENHGETDQS